MSELLSRFSAARAAELDRLDAALSTRPAASDYTSGRATLVDNLDALVSGRMLQSSTGVAVIRPSAASSLTVTCSASVWTYGAWAQIAAASDLSSHALVGYAFRGPNGPDGVLQIGTGGAGSEVAVTAIPSYEVNSSNNRNSICRFFPVPITIPANARVAARAANGGGAAYTFQCYFMFLSRPY